MRDYKGLQKLCRDRVNRSRVILFEIEKQQFKDVWDKCNDKERSMIEGWIALNQCSQIREFLKLKIEKEIHEMSGEELRCKARQYRIPYYGNKCKDELILEICYAIDRNNKI